MLREIRTYIEAHDQVSLSDLALRFETEETAMSSMLELLIQKKVITKIEKVDCGGGCAGCHPSSCVPSGPFYQKYTE